MGGYHGAESCELVGLYMLNEIAKFVPAQNVGLYRDDGLMVIKKQPRQKAEKLKKKLHKFAKDIGLGLEIEGPMQCTDFLDISLDLKRQIYAPYRKNNNEIKYITTESNHPQSIIKQIPKMIGKRITKRSINNEEFAKVASAYNQALKASDKENIKYEPQETAKNKRKRKRKTIWYNPPFCKTVKTRIQKQFINIVKKCFTKETPLYKILNKDTMNLSYSCMPSIGSKINAHNKKILQKQKIQPTKSCNCTKFVCPLKDSKSSCRTESVIYEATVTTKDDQRTYIGFTENEFKKRFYQHRSDINNGKKDKTELSKYVCELKEKNTNHKITWKIVKQVTKPMNGNKMCRLCTTEASIIIKNKKGQLNTRNEIMHKCRHQNKFLLKSWKERKKDN